MRLLSQAPDVLPVQDAIAADHVYRATGDMPWLRMCADTTRLSGEWVQLTFCTSFLDPLCRPLLRCITSSGHEDFILPGALFGRAIWLGKLPKDIQEIWISPTNKMGVFSFRIESLIVVSRRELLAACLRHHPLQAVVYMAAHLWGETFLGDLQIYRALTQTPLAPDDAWRQSHCREPDVSGLETPRFDWNAGPMLVFLIDGSHREPMALIERLQAQPYAKWRLWVVGPDLRSMPGAPDEVRVSCVGSGDALDSMLAELPADALIAVLPPESMLPDYVLMVLAEAAHADENCNLFYGDEEFIQPDGLRRITLKPDWSPFFFSNVSYFGRALFFKCSPLRRIEAFKSIDLLKSAPDIAVRLIADGCQPSHIRRVLLSRAEERAALEEKPRSKTPAISSGRRTVSIIIPTRDCFHWLRTCVTSLREKVLNDGIEVIIVDNGSRETKAIALLSELSLDKRFRVLSQSGDFNFSALCNAGAQASRSSVLLFLNNDTEFKETAGLETVFSLAEHPQIGAVGAKLLYPDGSVQHAGLALGIDGYTGHFERGAKTDEPGTFGALLVPHEVSAVTGAFLAIEKTKFDAVGGFDAENLPIELSDVDLCLRLAQRGWATVCACDCVVTHHESRSRGKTAHPDILYEKERRYMRSKWINKLRDDPYFHPALSLNGLKAALA